MSKSTLEVLLRIAWRTVGAIVTRVVAEGVAARDPLEGLRRIGIDEISHKKRDAAPRAHRERQPCATENDFFAVASRQRGAGELGGTRPRPGGFRVL